jgi:death-on-curing protein
MRYLTLAEVLHIHEGVLAQSGGLSGVRDLAALESALSQPKASAGGADAYPSLVEKAAALCYSLCSNHPFVDGNKRVAHAAMEVFLILNGSEIRASVDEQERLMLGVASGSIGREQLGAWLEEHSHGVSGSAV